VQSLCSNWCAVLKSFVEIILLPLGYLHIGTRGSYISSACITNGCVTNGTTLGRWESSCSDGKCALLWIFMIGIVKWVIYRLVWIPKFWKTNINTMVFEVWCAPPTPGGKGQLVGWGVKYSGKAKLNGLFNFVHCFKKQPFQLRDCSVQLKAFFILTTSLHSLKSSVTSSIC
jgi:hypothetical protein